MTTGKDGTHGAMNILAYLGRGIFHERRGMPCQDAVDFRIHENGTLVMALADGAGQAKYAEDAAIRTVQSVRAFFRETPLSEFLKLDEYERKTVLLGAIRRKLMENLDFQNSDAPEFSATLIFAVMDAETVLFGHLGDGAAYAADMNGELIFASEPDRGAESRTWFSVSWDAEAHFRMETRPAREIVNIALLSDGPYAMFRNRGGGDASKTALELMGYAREGHIINSDDLKSALDQMAEIPSERMDDWSVILYDAAREPESDYIRPRDKMIVSMIP